ncbi:MAG: TetR/AcrR family transcriptional regulator [Candidatus Eremiobacteraeota bacterium]|nr:TetR/AcrR family transcriptional regulator [Candidatus Eremiobacteraeota bacterium]
MQTAVAARPASEGTRERILRAAREIFAQKGPHGTTTREIADRAGVNEATLFRHFGNKRALLDAMKEFFCQGREVRLQALYVGLSGNLEPDLKTIGRAIVDAMQQNVDLMRVALLEETLDPDAARVPWRAPNLSREYLTRFLAEHVERGTLRGDPQVLARFFMGMFFSYTLGLQFWKSSLFDDDEKAVTTFVGIFLDGARNA